MLAIDDVQLQLAQQAAYAAHDLVIYTQQLHRNQSNTPQKHVSSFGDS